MAKGYYYIFKYDGYRKGSKVTGTQKAFDKDELAIRLSNKDIKLLKAKPLFKTKASVSNKTIIRFSSQMYSMLRNGINSSEALIMCAEYADEDFRYILKDVISSLNKGLTLAESFRRSGFFSALFCETIAMGEDSANLDKSFENIRGYYENEGYIKKKIKGMMMYPMIVSVVLLIVTIVMSAFIMPKFADVYLDMGAELPLITQLYIRFGQFIISSWWLCIIVVFGIIKGFKYYKRGTLNRKNIDRLLLDIPLTGNIYSKILVARFSNVLALYLKSGVQMQSALLSSAKVLQNYSVYDEFIRGAKQLLKGHSVFEIVDEISIFPPFYKQVVYTGEKSGDLANSLVRLADTMDDEAKEVLETSSAILNQAIIIVLFVALAPTIIAILLPVINLTTVASEAGGL